MRNTVLKYGLIGGGIVSVFLAVSIPYMTDNSNSMGEVVGYASMVISLSTIFIGIKTYRDKNLGGLISFMKAFKLGFLIALVASTMYVLTWMIFSEIYAPNFMEEYINNTMLAMKEKGMTAEAISVEMEGLKAWAEYYKNPLLKALITYMEILPVGLLVSLVSAFILKKKTA